ncbi:kinase-like protein [Corynespora cassiicola Philippines]|uniref:Kinase-like protein n=1 Tax=Corynespora cassiicola Philippines TaxID=1448308 RepID=A0A2T2PBN6_CORCC|nr:kinase-like protein [Corynespora cassiicola Philippines]
MRTGWGKKKLKISAPGQPIHIGHISHDEITQKLQGLPPEWVAVLRDNGVIGEDLVLPRKSKSRSFYGNGMFNLSNSSFLSSRSLQKLWKTMSGNRSNQELDTSKEMEPPKEPPNASGTWPNSGADSAVPSQGIVTTPEPLSISPILKCSSAISRQSTVEQLANSSSESKILAVEFGLPFSHHDYQEINNDLFQVVESLGHGSLGVVEEVRISSRCPSFVRKRVQIPYHKRKQYLKIIRQEAHVIQSLSHCHIVRIIGSYSEIPTSGRQFYSLLMAPVGERDLKTFLDMAGDQSMLQIGDCILNKKDWLRTWFKCLSSALEYIHSHGVRHQDIKPSNIIHKGDTIYFTDFSSASQFEIGKTTSTENPARTSAMYAAPEVIESGENLHRHGRGTDVFALGAVFTEMLAVLNGNTVDNYHRSLLQSGQGPHAIPIRTGFLYGRVLTDTDAFFHDDPLYCDVVAPMLRPNRDQRPDAKEVATSFRKLEPWASQKCACDMSAA